MLPANPFLQLTLPRAAGLLARLAADIWSEAGEVSCAFSGGSGKPLAFEEARRLNYTPVSFPFHWGKLFDQGWFRLALAPTAGEGPLYLHWADQGEGTLYVDAVPYYGFDVAHRHCVLPPGTTEAFMEGLCLQSAIWHPAATGLDAAGSRLSAAQLMRRDERAWEVYHDLRTLYDLALEDTKTAYPVNPPPSAPFGYRPPVDVAPVVYRRLLRALDDAVNAHDRGGLAAAGEALKAAYVTLGGQHERIRAALTGHAHIDLVWLWPERTSEYKAVHTFSTMNRLMDAYPEMVFAYSQPASYDAVERISPALSGQVRERIAQQRWEPVGAMEVESDTLIACGEALARSFLIGQRGFERLQGSPSRVCWLPDVFGYCGCLPQIMRQCGVEYFFTTKLTWSNINLFPYSSFIWRGMDGTGVLVHVTQGNGYNQAALPEELRRGAQAHRQSDVHGEFLAPTGYGDGGGGVTEEMCERARRCRSLAGLPEVGWTRIDDFFDRLNGVRPSLPVYQGELYLEYHRGVLTTHGNLKAAFRSAERALQTWEAARCTLGGGEVDAHPWRRLVFAQFHDYIPGTSIWEVYEEGIPELQGIAADALAAAATEMGDAGQPALFNPLPVETIEIVRDANGRPGKAISLPPLAGVILADVPALLPPGAVEASATALRSNSVEAGFDARGQIERLQIGGRAIALTGPLAQLVLYPDVPHGFDAWDIDRQTLSLGEVAESEAQCVAANGGSLGGTVEFRRRLGAAASEVTVRYRLDAFQPVLHVEYEIDWREEQTLLKALFPTAYAGRSARFGAPFGSVLRGQQAGQPGPEAMFEVAGSRWAVVSDDGEAEGLGVVTEAKYGWSCRDGSLTTSLLRSATVTGGALSDERLFPPTLRRPGAAPRARFSDLGRHVIHLALCLHAPGEQGHRSAPRLADSLFTRPLPYRGKSISAGFLGLENDSLVPSWAKPAADGRGWILRLHEAFGRRGAVRLKLAPGLKARRTDLSEKDAGGGTVTDLPYTPYELISLRISR